MRIFFEDNGQDFLWWDIDSKTGKVMDCGPFQADTWANGHRHVELESLTPGEQPFCYADAETAAQKLGNCLVHAIIRVENK